MKSPQGYSDSTITERTVINNSAPVFKEGQYILLEPDSESPHT